MEPLRCVPEDAVLTGWDFSTGGVKCLAFDLDGNTLAEVRLDTDQWVDGDARELNLFQLEGHAHASTRAVAAKLRDLGLLDRWAAGGVSATHHTAGRIDALGLPVRRAICWNDQTLPAYHARGLERLGGPDAVERLIGGPWASRYTLSHLVKDEQRLSEKDWKRTWKMLPHGSLSAGYLTGNFEVCSVSSAASTGIMHFRDRAWCRGMLGALERPEYRDLAWQQLPRIVDAAEPVGPLAEHLAVEAVLKPGHRPLIFPTSDDQQAGLAGGGAVDDGQVAVVLGNSAVVNSSSEKVPSGGCLDVMRLNWGPYLWMRCFNNGAQFLDKVVGKKDDYRPLEEAARLLPAGAVVVLPFVHPEPSMKVARERIEWSPEEPADEPARFRAALEAIAYLIKRGVREHEQAGQRIERVSVSGGIARSDLMCEVLATVLQRPLHRLVSFEGPALGAAAAALASLESHGRKQRGVPGEYRVADAVARMVRFRQVVQPNDAWREAYGRAFAEFERRLG